MQSVRDELDKYRDLYEDKCREQQEQIDKRNQVMSRKIHEYNVSMI